MGKCLIHGSSAPLEGNAATGDVLNGKTFYNTDAMERQTGTMTNNGAVSASVAVGGSYTIPSGYHNGSGKVSGPTLSGDATVGNVLSGKTFYSNSGTKQTGTMTNRGAVTQTLAGGGSYTIPAGYHNGSGKVTAKKYKAVRLGTVTLKTGSGGTQDGTATATFDVKSVRPNTYSSLTVDDFVQVGMYAECSYGDVKCKTSDLSYSYNASTGVLTIKSTYKIYYGWWGASIDVMLVEATS